MSLRKAKRSEATQYSQRGAISDLNLDVFDYKSLPQQRCGTVSICNIWNPIGLDAKCLVFILFKVYLGIGIAGAGGVMTGPVPTTLRTQVSDIPRPVEPISSAKGL